jgi:hypothetical protein
MPNVLPETYLKRPSACDTSFRSLLDVARGKYEGLSVVHKFGRNEAVGTTPEPVSLTGVYQTPTVLTSIEIVSGSADDTAAGTGAQKVFIQGLSTDWELTSEIVTMNGTTPVALTNQYFRLFRSYVYESGTYATAAAPSHAGVITIRTAGAGASWLVINDVSVFAKGQSQCAVYTVPSGYTAYISGIDIHVEATKPATIFLFKREGADIVTSPYSAMRLVKEWDGLDGSSNYSESAPLGPFPEKTDIGFMARVASGSARVAVDFEILLVQN